MLNSQSLAGHKPALHLAEQTRLASNTDSPPPEDEKEGLDAIDAYIKAQKVGFETDYVFPFTAQQRKNIRLQFPIDTDFYTKYDNRLLSVTKLHFRLLALLFINIILYSLFVVIPSRNLPDSLNLQAIFSPEWSATFPAIFAFGLTVFGLVAAYVFRAWARETQINPFASDIDHHYNHVMHQISDCEKKIGNRQDLAREPEMSEHWAKIMLWSVLRLRDADRYASIISWKIFASTRNAFVDFATASALLILVPFGVLRDAWMIEDALILVGPIVLTFAGRWGRGLLATPIKQRTVNLSIAKPFQEFGECVRRIVTRARAGEWKKN